MAKTALICGVGGQDGSYLAKLLLEKGYRVVGTSRNPSSALKGNLATLGVAGNIECIAMESANAQSVNAAINNTNPDEVYYLAGESSVAKSFEEPVKTFESITLGAIYLLEAIKFKQAQTKKQIRLFNAGSSDCFGNASDIITDESTSLNPVSPYAIAKSSVYWLVKHYRQSYDMYTCTGTLFNHESPLRPAHFVTQKIIQGVKEIAAGRQEKLVLGRLDIARDWGWAPEYVEAMWLMLQQDKPEDFVIATGTTITLMDFVKTAFEQVGLDWQSYVVQDPAFMRPTDLMISRANNSKISHALGWQPKVTGTKVVQKMFEPI
jgi:GDPmannose 4,6-dehydratase